MPALITNNFDDESIKNESTSMETPFSHYKSTGIFMILKGIESGQIWLKFELVWDFMQGLITCKYKKHPIKSNQEKVDTPFFPL